MSKLYYNDIKHYAYRSKTTRLIVKDLCRLICNHKSDPTDREMELVKIIVDLLELYT